MCDCQLLASLNHTHIAAIHGLEVADGKPFLVLERVEGEDLSERLKCGPIPADDVIKIAKQIAESAKPNSRLKQTWITATPAVHVESVLEGESPMFCRGGGSQAAMQGISNS